MNHDSAGLDSGTAREECGGAKHNVEKPSLVDTIKPAVGSGDHSVGTDEGTSAHTGARDTGVGSEKTSL